MKKREQKKPKLLFRCVWAEFYFVLLVTFVGKILLTMVVEAKIRSFVYCQGGLFLFLSGSISIVSNDLFLILMYRCVITFMSISSCGLEDYSLEILQTTQSCNCYSCM